MTSHKQACSEPVGVRGLLGVLGACTVHSVTRAIAACVCLIVLASAGPAAAKGKDRIVISGPVTIARGEVAKDVVVVDGNVSVAGRVTGDLVVVKGKATISGQVKGDVLSVVDRVTVRSGARVGGDVQYVDTKPVVASGARVGGKVKRIDVDKAAGGLGLAAGIGIWLALSVSALLLGVLLLWLVPRAAIALADTAGARKGAAIGLGVALFLGIPIIAVLLVVSLLGLPLGVVLGLALLPLYALAYTSSAWLLGNRILGRERNRFLAFLAGLAILRLLALVPILGGVVWLAATVFGLGVLFLAAGRGRRSSPRAGAPTERSPGRATRQGPAMPWMR